MEAELLAIAIDTFKTAFYISFPMLMGGLIVGLVISIFQATTQINEMTLSFVPKIIVVAIIIVIFMPWMTNMMVDFTVRLFEKIPHFAS
ncbi:MAG: flagellar biosynthesis protein FliQ [Campylobacterota bacterium]|nr:flagellar biosynthesis protein FliQ [Campylobacterota bacterium]